MKNDKRSEYVTRDAVMKLLSDNEVASVSTAETAKSLKEHEEYLDLETLARGVQKWAGAGVPMGNVLPRKAVQPETWSKIVAQLAAQPPAR